MNTKRLLSLVLALAMVLTLLAACTPADPGNDGTSSQAPAGKIKYQVTVIDPNGEPCANGVAVKFFDKSGKQVAMQMTDANGIAAREMEAGDYTAQLHFTDDSVSYTYDAEALTLSATKTELRVELYNQPTETVTLYLSMGLLEVKEVEAYIVGTGMTKVKLNKGERTHFVLSTRQTGFYEISFTGEIDLLGQYGSAMSTTKIDGGDRVEGKENVLSLNLHDGYVSAEGNQTFVFGIDAPDTTTEGVLNIMRQGDYVITPAIAPWTIYQTTAALTRYTLPEGAVLKDFYMAAEYTLVYNEQDGYYHKDTADGPLVLLRLGDKAKGGCRFSLDPFESLFETPEILGVVYFHENGEFDRKLGFEECLREYVDKAMDPETGLVPLNKELEYIIKEMGAYKQWWDINENGQIANTGSFLFWDEDGNPIRDLNMDTVWLFNCCYIEE